ncbi:MAG: hypothetical protein E4H10_07430 [Bacteroidia bacterium]|nr:MAG: hypothetical protein E4H10_07430 [Bacteroidia bacterium]
MLHQLFRERMLPGFVVFIAFSLTVFTAVSCEKSEGLGGTGSISGTVKEQYYNDDYSLLIYEKPAVDEEVFIVFGDEKALGNRVRTNMHGQFMFKYLYPGKYEVYFLSGDSASVLDLDVELSWTVELGKGEDLNLGELVKMTPLDFDDGTAMIKGRVKVIDYVDASAWPNLVIEKTYYGTEQEVYLTYGDHAFYDERIRSQFDGTFEFGGLIPGNYLVFLYSDEVTGESDKVALKFEVSVTGLEQLVDLGEIVIEKL